MANKDTEVEEGTVDAPDWLDAMLIEDALHRLGDKNVHVQRVSVRMAAAAGDHFGSALYRVRAHLAAGEDGAVGERWLLVKAPPLAAAVAQSVAEAGLFRRETAMLARLLPQMQVGARARPLAMGQGVAE
ncbi:hypothetical protein R5R35_001164 [Gryllus longicercus]|uniref:Uncharacterized protein n=1 Tax=Gryllus longicercus TaxID=2509291 RepID=A0AAN9VQ06_9ORTH